MEYPELGPTRLKVQLLVLPQDNSQNHISYLRALHRKSQGTLCTQITVKKKKSKPIIPEPILCGGTKRKMQVLPLP